MKTISKFREKLNKEQKREAILKWMAGFSVTVVVVATAVIEGQRENPSISFDRVSAVGTTIVYQTTILDPGATITQDSLLLEIASSLEIYEVPLVLGQTSGTHQMRYAESEYTLTIKGSQGFGEKAFISEKVKSKLLLSGAVSQYQLLNREEDSVLQYEVSTLYYDPSSTLESVWLRFGYLENYYLHNPDAVPNNDIMIPITSASQTMYLPEIPNDNYTVFLTLEGRKTDQSILSLDEIRFKTPLKIYGSLYVEDIGPDYLTVFPYISEHYLREEVVTVSLWENEKQIQSKTLTFSLPVETASEFQEPMSESIVITFDKLKSYTPYGLKMHIQYIDEITGKTITKLVASASTTTTKTYQSDVAYSLNGSLLHIDLNIDDPNAVLSDMSYTIFDVSGEFEMYLNSGVFELIQTQGTISLFAMDIDLLEVTKLSIDIYATKTVDSVMFYGCILHTLRVNR